MKILDRLTTLGRQVQEATTTVSTNLAELRAQITAKGQAVQRARLAPAPAGEVIERFTAWIDGLTATQAREYVGSLIGRFGSAPDAHPSIVGPPWGPTAEVTWGFLALFAGDLVKARFADLVSAAEYKAGPAASERAAAVAQLERELAELEQAEEQLVDSMNAAGVQVAHRPAVVARRTTEAHQRQHAEEAAANRRAREAAIDAHHRRPRVASGSVAAINEYYERRLDQRGGA